MIIGLRPKGPVRSLFVMEQILHTLLLTVSNLEFSHNFWVLISAFGKTLLSRLFRK